MKINSSPYILFILLLVLWYWLWVMEVFPEKLLPAPHLVAVALFNLVLTKQLWFDLSISLYRVFLGFIGAALLGGTLGIFIAYYPNLDNYFSPFNNFVRYLPVAALLPLLILLFGTGDLEKFAVIFIGTFFQITILIRDDIKNLDFGYVESAKMLGLKSDRQIISSIILPARLPYILDIFKVGLGWAWSYLLVAEIVAADSGIGFKIMQANRFLQTENIFGYIIIIGVTGFLLDAIIEKMISSFFIWRNNEL